MSINLDNETKETVERTCVVSPEQMHKHYIQGSFVDDGVSIPKIELALSDDQYLKLSNEQKVMVFMPSNLSKQMIQIDLNGNMRNKSIFKQLILINRMLIQRINRPLNYSLFSQTKILMLMDNNICNIELLEMLPLNSLEEIALGGNHIANIKSFVKCDWKSINEIEIQSNKVNHFNLLTFKRVKANNLKDLQTMTYRDINNEFSYFLALQTLCLSQFTYYPNNQIDTQKVKEQLKLRYPAAQVWTRGEE